MSRLRKFAGLILAGSVFYVTPAHAQATRTWVSGVGDDVNPCSRTAPCKTFAGAISKTAAGGEINCLDPGGWGSVTITKALTIDCSQFPGSILNSGGVNGIIVNAGAGDNVVIRGLEIAAGTGASAGLNGVRFVAGGSLTLENMIIRNQQNTDGSGIAFQPSGASRLYLNNVTITTSGNGAGGGILVAPSSGSGSAIVALNHVRIDQGSSVGLRVDVSAAGSGGVTLQTDDARISGNGSFGVFLFAGTSGIGVRAMIVNSTIANNTNGGIVTNGASTVTLVSNTTINANGQGVVTSGGTILSYQDNRLFGNGANNTFPGTISHN